MQQRNHNRLFFTEWPDPEKVTVLLEGVNASVDLHTLGDFTFTRLTPTRRFPFSFQCPNGSPPGRSAEETLKQVYQVLNDQYFNPSMSGTSSQAGGHHPTCSETNTNNDENGLSQPSGENDAAQKLLQGYDIVNGVTTNIWSMSMLCHICSVVFT